MTENQTPTAGTLVQTSGDKKAPKVTTQRCNCGCGEATSSSKTQYKPGHDARHAGAVARAMASAKINGDTSYTPALEDLPSPKLRAKAEAMAKRIVEQVASKASKAKTAKTPKAPKADKAVAATVAAEEAAHAEASKPAEPMFSDDEPAGFPGTVKVGRWEYPAKYNNGETLRNTKRDGSGEWVPFS